jgi:XTP/dITP diphosphohydrolase
MEIHFATSNPNKFREASEFFRANLPDVQLKHFVFQHNEIRSDDLAEIAREALDAVYAKLKKPVFVEDGGLFVDALNGFPGTYSAWVQKKISNKGILKLLEGEKNRSARFETVIAYTDGKQAAAFRGICEGSVAERAAGESGLGYDPIFVPAGHSTTFAQSIELKNKLSHRYKSLQLLLSYLKNSKKI